MLFHRHLSMALTALVITLLSAQAEAQIQNAAEDRQIKEAKTRYGFDSWKRGALSAGIDVTALKFESFVGRTPDIQPGSMIGRTFEDEQGHPRFIVEFLVADNVRGAHNRLAEQIAFVSSLKTLPTLESFGVAAGDVGFVGRAGLDQDRTSWIAFARDNVFVRLLCLDPRENPHPDLFAVSRIVDAEIRKHRLKGVGQSVPRPSVSRFSIAPTARAGDVVRIDVEAGDGSGKKPHVGFVLGGSGQGYVERHRDGFWYLHTTGVGKINLTAHVTGALGTRSVRTNSIEVVE